MQPRPRYRRAEIEQAPERGPAPSEGLSGGLKVLAVLALLFGSCSGLGTGCDTAMRLGTLDATSQGQQASMSYGFTVGSSKAKIPIDARGTAGVLKAGLLFQIPYVLACVAAVVLAWIAFSSAFARAWLGRVAAALAALRLILAGLDYLLVEKSMEIARAALRTQAGYSFNKVGQALNQAEDLGGSSMIFMGVGVAIFWIVAAVAFWQSPTSE